MTLVTIYDTQLAWSYRRYAGLACAIQMSTMLRMTCSSWCKLGIES